LAGFGARDGKLLDGGRSSAMAMGIMHRFAGGQPAWRLAAGRDLLRHQSASPEQRP